jgi:signal transduction histidine kinase
MMWTVIGAVIAAFFLVLFLMLWRDMRQINDQLQQIMAGERKPFIRQNSPLPVSQRLVHNGNSILRQIERVTEEKVQSEMARKQLICNISHDLRTPLTSLLGYVDMLKKEEALAPEERKAYIDVIERKAQTLYELVEHFFELSRLEAGDEPLNCDRLNISETVRQHLFAYYQDFKQRELEPELDLPPEDLFAYGDRRALQRVMTNLISNSLRYGTGGDRFGVRVREEGAFVRVEVWDNGQGIAEDKVDEVFQRTYHAEPKGQQMAGSGLGLHIVKKLVERMGGTVSVSSKPYVRTAFAFSLPQQAKKKS